MDFAKLVTDYLNQRTEGDPSFIVSEESIAFVDLMRADDMDRRASSVESNTSADARGEPSTEDVASESRRDPVSESHSGASPSAQEESPEIITAPASPFSDVALGGNKDAGALSDMQEPDVSPLASGIFTEDGQPSQPSAVISEPQQQSEPLSAISESQQQSEPAAVFTEDGSQAAPNSSLQEEGVTVREHVTSKSETTILEPPSMPDFESLLQSFDRDYRPPDPTAGDLDLIPEAEEPEPSEPLENPTEFCEVMMSEILSTHLAYDRRGA